MEEEHDTDATTAYQVLEARVFSPEITSTLLDLAHLARQAGAARSEQDAHSIATALLTCLLSLCAAQRGALLQASKPPVPITASSKGAQDAAKSLRLLASQGIQEHEVSSLAPLLPAMPSDLSTIQGGSALSCWLISHSSLDGSATDQPTQAYLLLFWDSLAEQPCTPALERSRTLLPQLADAIGAVLSSLQLAARLQELDIKRGEAIRDRDVLSPDLLATISHELRSPLTAIKGYASTLLRHASRLSREERSQFLLAISEASDQLDRVIGRLLELAQLESGSIPFMPVPVDPAHLAAEALLSAQQDAERLAPDLFAFQLCLQTSQGEEAECVPLIQADPRLLREALDTLLENAVKYSPEGGKITVRLRPTTDEQTAPGLPNPSGEQSESTTNIAQPEVLLDLCVCDQGIGIAADQIERIFERFYQVDQRLTREAGGAGLGLAICKHIVELHRGQIWVESQPGEGSTFHLVVPIQQRPAKEQEQELLIVE